ncbi:MAG: zinc-binding dehydrogenase [Phycisphaerales bacterium]|nr:zinc-binding dehydrogenase [Phycisphaerales bacterium]
MPSVLAAVMTAPHQPIELRELPFPELEPDSALLRVELSEICGTDVHLQEGRLAGVPYPIIPGHVSVGVLERIRGQLFDVDGRPFAEGNRVTFLDVHRTCHRCRACLIDKASTRCPRRKVYGITYGVADGLTGGWAQYVYIKPGTICIRLDAPAGGSGSPADGLGSREDVKGSLSRMRGGSTASVSSELFMAGGCSLPTALHAAERAEIRIGDTVLVLGAGPVGLSCVAFARLCGAGQVLCIGAPDARLEVALRMGADKALNFQTGRALSAWGTGFQRDACGTGSQSVGGTGFQPVHEGGAPGPNACGTGFQPVTCSTGFQPVQECTEQQRLEWVRSLTQGRGADVAIEAAGAPAAVVQAMRFTRDAGRVVIVGQYTNAGDVSLSPHADINRKHLDIRGCWGSDYSHFHRAVEVLRTDYGRRTWGHMHSQRRSLGNLNEALDEVAHARSVKLLVTP